MALNNVTALFWNESSGLCDCCGNKSRTIWGELDSPNKVLAVYYVQWTEDMPEHYPNVDLVMGSWDEGTAPDQRFLVSLLYRPAPEGGSFMVINSDSRPAYKNGLCGTAMAREEVIGTPLAAQVFALVDALWLTEPRMAALKHLDDQA